MNMTVGIFQLDSAWQKPLQNLSNVENLLASLDTVPDVLVLPEMWATGFSMSPEECPLSLDDIFFERLHRIIEKHNVAIVGTLPIKENNHFYNRAIFLSPDSFSFSYNKQYLFSPSKENIVYKAGNSCPSFIYNDWNIKLQICYDLRFPESVRNDENPELLIYMANWPDKRIHHWNHLLVARAIENQAIVIGCNRTGIDKNDWNFPGDSKVIHPDGSILADIKGNPYHTVTIDFNDVKAYRKKYPFYLDKR